MTWTTQPRYEVGGLAAIVAGDDGPPVLLIHGVGLRAEAWGGQIDALAGHYRVCAVDLPGHGESGRLSGPANLATFTDAITDIVTGPALVIGHSFGAMIALDMAIRYPARVSGVAALNAIYRRSDAAKQTVRARAEAYDGRTFADQTSTLNRWFGAGETPERTACKDWLGSVDPEGYRTAYGVFAREDGPADQGLLGLHCPALFLTGGQEPNSTPRMSQAMAALAPLGQEKVIPDAAHMLPMTHAHQANTLLTQFAMEVFG